MSQQDVQIAFQAGFVTYELEDYTEGGYDIRYERFADLIRVDEREAVLDLVDGYAKNNTDLRDAIRARGNT